MRRTVFAAAAVVAFGAAQPPKDDPAKAELAKLQGEWAVKSIEVAGMPLPGDLPGKLVIEGAKFGGLGSTMTITLDPTKAPKEIDLVRGPGGQKWMGLYKLDGDTLTLCLAMIEKGKPEAQTRPADFDRKKVQMLVTAVRPKK
ncbi:MAG: TIGR03067 domain-containing protein [Gemmataceae bacterium]